MKTLFALSFSWMAFFCQAQQPEITGDLMLCPNGEGTAYIVNDMAYDSYQWYYKYWFLPDDFQAIDGADGPSFTYDWYTYDQALLKVVATLGDQTYESNTIQIDSWAFAGLTVATENTPNVTFNPELWVYELCEGTSFGAQINAPYTSNVQWFLNGEPIEGANEPSFSISEAGSYSVSGSPEQCPDFVLESAPMDVVIVTDCELGVEAPALDQLRLYPNPVADRLYLSEEVDGITLYAITGQKLREVATAMHDVRVSDLAPGMYLARVVKNGRGKTFRFIKS